MKKVFIILFWLVSFSACAQTPVAHYVKTGGNDANTGLSDAQAWATITKVNGHAFIPGDSILFKRGDTWVEKGYQILTIDNSGTPGHPITFGAFGTGSKPIITGRQSISGWNTISNWTNQSGNIWYTPLASDPFRVWLSDVEAYKCQTNNVTANQNWFWDNGTKRLYIFSATNPATSFSNIEGIYINICIYATPNTSDYITIQNLDIRGAFWLSIYLTGVSDWIIEDCFIGRDGNNGVMSNGSDGIRNSSNNVIIRNCIFDSYDHNVDLYSYNNTYEAISVYTGAKNWDIHDNIFKDWSHAAYNLQQNTANRPYINMKFHHNYCSASNIDYGRAYTIHLKTDPGASYGNEIYNNYFYDFGILSEFTGTGDSFKFYNNIIDKVRYTDYPPFNQVSFATGIYIQAFTGDIVGLEIFNNIITNCEGNGIGIWYNATNHVSDVLIKNNIIVNNGLHQIRYEWSPGYILDNTFQNNLLYKSGTLDLIYYQKMQNDAVMTVAEFNAMNGITTGMNPGNVADVITNNINGDPLFVDATNTNYLLRDYHLKTEPIASPALGAGINVGLVTDYDGYAWLSPPNIGVFTSGSNVVNPIFVGSVVENENPGVLEIVFDVPLDNVVPPLSAFTVQVNFENIAVTGVSILGDKIRLVLAKAVAIGDNVTVTYIKPTDKPLQSGSGKVASFYNKKVTNNVGSTFIPSELVINMYPNPAKDLLNIFFVEPSLVPYKLRIITFSGKILFEKLLDIGNQNVEIPINYNSGIYIVQVLAGKIIMNVQSLVVIN